MTIVTSNTLSKNDGEDYTFLDPHSATLGRIILSPPTPSQGLQIVPPPPPPL